MIKRDPIQIVLNSSSDWLSIENLLNELIDFQQKKLLQCGQQVVPKITLDDLLQPNDFLELEHHPVFRYEEGVLAGLQTTQMALQALKRDRAADDNFS